MAESKTLTAPLSPLAKKIELDIKRRGLAPGDPYLTADEVGRHFGTQGRTASRAMAQLAEIHLLVRRRGAGTFVGPGIESENGVALGTVYVLVSTGRLLTGLPIDQMVVELGNALRDCQIRLAVVPDTDQRQFVNQLLESGADGRPIGGVVLVGCSRQVHEVVVESGICSVVFGSVHATSRRLFSVDADHRAMGFMAARYLADRGCKKMAIILRDHWLPGDNHFLDGVNEAMATSVVDHGSPVLRSLPAEHDAIVAEVAHMLEGGEGPTGLICRGRLFAESVLEAVASVGREVGEGIEVIANLDAADQGAVLPIPVVAAETSYREQVVTLGRLLQDQMDGTRRDDEHVVLPVKLIEHKRTVERTGA
jgi:DNA-binding LacI/PurR family transcriptional regulator